MDDPFSAARGIMRSILLGLIGGVLFTLVYVSILG